MLSPSTGNCSASSNALLALLPFLSGLVPRLGSPTRPWGEQGRGWREVLKAIGDSALPIPSVLRYNPGMIGILSDSHDNLDAVRRAVRFFRNSGCGLVIHAGDFVAPFSAQILGEIGCAVKAVFGNCDGEKEGLKAMIGPFGAIRKAPFVFSHEAKKIAITHLDGPVKALSAGREYDLIVYGHTHRPEIRRVGNTLIVNPGEAGGWVTGRSTLALYDPATDTAEIVSF